MKASSAHVAVVGAGVVGLSSAIRLREAGLRVTVLAERVTPRTTSDRAGAVFTPFRMDADADAPRWARASYDAFGRLAREVGPACGISIGPLRELLFDRLQVEPWWSGAVDGYERLRDVPPPYLDGVRAVVPRVDMRRYMPWLTRRFQVELGGELIERRVESLAALFDEGFDLVVHCSGLGAEQLASDPAMSPMRGQVLHVANSTGLRECLVEQGRGAVTTYVFPFDDYVVLGGTYERGATREEVDESATAGIVQRCRDMLAACGYDMPACWPERRLRAHAGVRPMRLLGAVEEAVRLEAQEISPGRWVVHNYGHGRAGVTLSWGCAVRASELVLRWISR